MHTHTPHTHAHGLDHCLALGALYIHTCVHTNNKTHSPNFLLGFADFLAENLFFIFVRLHTATISVKPLKFQKYCIDTWDSSRDPPTPRVLLRAGRRPAPAAPSASRRPQRRTTPSPRAAPRPPRRPPSAAAAEAATAAPQVSPLPAPLRGRFCVRRGDVKFRLCSRSRLLLILGPNVKIRAVLQAPDEI